MYIKRAIDKFPGGMMLIPLFIGTLCHTFSSGTGKYFGSFTNGLMMGTVPILAVWFFCTGASIKLSATGTVLLNRARWCSQNCRCLGCGGSHSLAGDAGKWRRGGDVFRFIDSGAGGSHGYDQ